MDPDPLLFLTLIMGLIFFIGFIAIEISLVSVELHQDSDNDEISTTRRRQIDQLLNRTPQLLLTTALMRTLGVMITTSALASLLLTRVDSTLFIVTLLLFWLLLALLRVVVRAVVLLYPDYYVIFFIPIAQVTTTILWPITKLLSAISHYIIDEKGNRIYEDILLGQDGLRLLMKSRQEENQIEDAEKEMIASILDLDDTVVREVMVPRIDMSAISLDATLTDVLSIVNEEGRSRIPVYSENIDNIVGLVYAKDLLHLFQQERQNITIAEILRPAYFIPDSKKINVLFREMQAQKAHMAVVVDEYGGIAGLVTIEDLLEEIVGEIQDEYDAEQELLVQRIRPNVYLLNSRLSIYELEKVLDIEIEDKRADTVGGFIYFLSEHLPKQGEILHYGDWSFTVLSVDGHRIEQVRAEPAQPMDNRFAEQAAELASHRNSIFNYR
ncbi:MAG: hemolysin family protein [Chloroflexota bacterium]